MSDWKDKLRDLKRSLSGTDAQTGEDTRAPTNVRETPVRQPDRRYVCLGLDFGTSSTKVVIRLLQMGLARPVPFLDLGPNEQPYLAPTRLWIDKQGGLSLNARGEGSWVQELKVRLMEQPWDPVAEYPSARPTDLAAAYVALILRRVYEWFDREVRPALGGIEVNWSMNLGIPARDFDAKVIRDAFYVVARAGWHLAWQGGPINVKRAAEVVDAARRDGFSPKGIDVAFINIVPEVAAGVTTYVRSPGRQNGPHLFVDVGATTLDSSVFLLGDGPNGFRYTFLDADVDSQLGALRLHKYRAGKLGQLALAKFEASDPLKPIPETAAQCVPGNDEIERIDHNFRDRCVTKVCGVVVRAKNKSPADLMVFAGSVVTRTGAASPGLVRVLLSGGGIQLPLYQEVISNSGVKLAPGSGLGVTIKSLRTVPLPQPMDLQAPDLDRKTWERLAIAYGLSFAYDDIGEFIPPSSVMPMPLPRRSGDGSQFVSKDQV